MIKLFRNGFKDFIIYSVIFAEKCLKLQKKQIC